MADFDIIIRGGMIIDGQRTPRYKGDLGIKGGKVTSITGAGGLSGKSADKDIDADGLIVAPGFVDLHTHYDAQIFWDPYCTTGGWNGVTTAVIGNCGFGLAPVKKEDRKRAMLSLTRNEAISYSAMEAGVTWTWETFPEFMDALENTPKGINILTYVPLSPLISYVMGGMEAAKKRRPDVAEIEKMKQLIAEAINAGACGISAQRLGANSVQRDYDTTPNVTDIMHIDDFVEICSVLKGLGRGVVQVLGLTPAETERVCEASGALVIFNAVTIECDQHGMKSGEAWEELADWVADANKRGLLVCAQTVTTGVDYSFTFEDWSLYDYSPYWRELLLGSTAERLSKMQDPDRRNALRNEYDELMLRLSKPVSPTDFAPTAQLQYATVADNAVALVECEDLEHYEGMTIRQIAAKESKHVCDAILDIAVADALRTTFTTPPTHYKPEDIKKLITKPHTVPGISDGGAHLKFSWFGRYGTEYLVKYVRETNMVDLEYAHWHLSAIPARYAGIQDRGSIHVGGAADILVYDFDELGWTEVEKVRDLPAGDWRRITRGVGYRYTIVNGCITMVDSADTGATPGKFLRFGHA